MKETRRNFLLQTGGLLAAAMAGNASRLWAQNDGIAHPAAPKVEIVDYGFVSDEPSVFYGWPTIISTPEGQLIVAASAREDHSDPFGRVDIFRSHDGGSTWSWPQTIYDGPVDDRDAGILLTNNGSLLITTFTSSEFTHILDRQIQRIAEGREPGPNDWVLNPGRQKNWERATARLNEEQRRQENGLCLIFRSTDEGITWSPRIDSLVSSPHGPLKLSDGRLLYPGRNQRGPVRAEVAESLDDGQTWHTLVALPVRPGDTPAQYHEYHGVEAADGSIVLQLRNHNDQNEGETLQLESYDGGKNWTTPHPIGVWGHPSHLLRLADNRLLMTYSYRREPVAELARVSDDNGKTWSEPITLWHIDDMGHDFGYPSTAQLPDGTLVSVWYEVIKGTWIAAIRQTRWKLVD